MVAIVYAFYGGAGLVQASTLPGILHAGGASTGGRGGFENERTALARVTACCSYSVAPNLVRCVVNSV